MMTEMSGVDLGAPELSYLLATLNAPAIVGVDAKTLFPKKQSAREAMFQKGREELETHGWIRPIPDRPDESELDAELLELVSIIAAPYFVIATQRISGVRERQVVMHYMADENIVELSASEEETYRLGLVPDRDALFERIAAMLQLQGKAPSRHLEVDGELFEYVQSLAPKGRLEKAGARLESAGFEGKIADSIINAVYDPVQGQIVLIRTHSGEVEAGRRVRVFGEGKQAWFVKRSSPDATDFEMITSDAASLKDLLTVSLDELTD